MSATSSKPVREVLGLRVNRGGKFVRDIQVRDKLSVGGAPTDHIIKVGDKKSAVLFRVVGDGAELLLTENYRGEIGRAGEMLSFSQVMTIGNLRREGDRYVLPIVKGRTGYVEAEGLTFEFGYVPMAGEEAIKIPRVGPAYESQARWTEPDSKRFYRIFAVVAVVFGSFGGFASTVQSKEKEFKVEDLVRRVTKLEVPEVSDVGVITDAPVETGGGGGNSGGGGGKVGEGVPTTGVIAAITTLGTGSGKSIADILGAGGTSGDLDSMMGSMGGLRGAGGGGTLGGTGLGDGTGGTGLGGGVDGMGGLAGGFGPGGKGGGKLIKKKTSVSASAPSSVGGTGSGDANRSASVIGSVIRRHLAGIKNAYDTALKQNPNLGGGKIVVRFSIASSGDVTSVSIVSDSLSCASLTNSITSRIRSWKFPTISSGDVTVVYPFVFVASEG